MWLEILTDSLKTLMTPFSSACLTLEATWFYLQSQDEAAPGLSSTAWGKSLTRTLPSVQVSQGVETGAESWGRVPCLSWSGEEGVVRPLGHCAKVL